jgi:hypothetical protein
MKRFVWLVCLGVLAACLSARGEVRITVSDQASFDRLPKDLSEALASEENDIVVDFRKGVYHYREKHLMLKGLYQPRKRIVLQCNGSVFLAEGPDYQLKSNDFRTYSAPAKGPFDYRMGFVDLLTMQSVDMRGPVRAAWHVLKSWTRQRASAGSR